MMRNASRAYCHSDHYEILPQRSVKGRQGCDEKFCSPSCTILQHLESRRNDETKCVDISSTPTPRYQRRKTTRCPPSPTPSIQSPSFLFVSRTSKRIHHPLRPLLPPAMQYPRHRRLLLLIPICPSVQLPHIRFHLILEPFPWFVDCRSLDSFRVLDTGFSSQMSGALRVMGANVGVYV